MAKILDFNAIEQPTLEVVLRDKAKTHLHITAPSVELVERLQANTESITKACKTKDMKSLQVCYDLAAEFVSCNQEGVQINGDELRGVYGVDYTLLFVFFVAYQDFITDIKQAKN